MREKMLKETRFWLGYISVFVILTLFVAGLLASIEWVTRLLKEPVISPIYVAAGGICAFLACLKLKETR
jgi:nitrate reductase gamma subunit